MLDHFTDAIDDVQDLETGLQVVNSFIEIRSRLLRMQEGFLLLDKTTPNLSDTRVERLDLVPQVVRVGFDGKERRDRRDEVLVVVRAYLLDLGILGVDKALDGAEERLLLAAGMDLLDDGAELLKVLRRRGGVERLGPRVCLPRLPTSVGLLLVRRRVLRDVEGLQWRL